MFFSEQNFYIFLYLTTSLVAKLCMKTKLLQFTIKVNKLNLVFLNQTKNKLRTTSL